MKLPSSLEYISTIWKAVHIAKRKKCYFLKKKKLLFLSKKEQLKLIRAKDMAIKLNINFLLLIFVLVNSLVFTHGKKHNKSNNIRQWSLTNNNQLTKASLLMFKEENVYLEKANGEILKYPLSSLSKDDRKFVNERYARIKELNQGIIYNKNQEIKNITDPLFIESAFTLFQA